MKKNQKKQGIALSFITTGIGALISIVYMPFMLRTLGQSEYGVYNIAASIISYLSLLNFGMNNAYVRFYIQRKIVDDHQGIARLNGMYIIVFTVISVVAFSSGLILAQFSEVLFGSSLTIQELAQLKRLTYILAVNLGISLISNIFSAHIVANESFIFARAVHLISTIVNPLVSFMMLVKGFASMGLAVAVIISTLISFSLNMYYCIKRLHIKFDFSKFDLRLFKEVAIFSFFIFINIIVDEINWQADKTILGVYKGSVDTAVYSLAMQINSLYISFSTSVSSVFIPKVTKLVASGASKESISAEFKRVGRYQFILMGLICSGFVFFGRPFVEFWGGVAYMEAYTIVIIIMVAELIPLTQNLGIEIQRAMNKHAFRSILYIIIALFNISISIPLGRAYGGIGCVAGTAIGLVIGNILVINWYYQKVLRINIKAYYKQIFSLFPSLLIPICLGTLSMLYYVESITIFVVFILLYSAVYCISIYLFGLKTGEREAVKRNIRKLRLRT